MFKVKYIYHYNQFLQCKENELCIDVYLKQSWKKIYYSNKHEIIC